MSDMVNHPPHYKAEGIEAIDVIEAFCLDFSLGNAVKYILRAGRKGDALEDLRKAAWYLARAIENRTPAEEVIAADIAAGDYDGQKDFAGSLNAGYEAIRERVKAGGPGWVISPTERRDTVAVERADHQRERVALPPLNYRVT